MSEFLGVLGVPGAGRPHAESQSIGRLFSKLLEQPTVYRQNHNIWPVYLVPPMVLDRVPGGPHPKSTPVYGSGSQPVVKGPPVVLDRIPGGPHLVFPWDMESETMQWFSTSGP